MAKDCLNPIRVQREGLSGDPSLRGAPHPDLDPEAVAGARGLYRIYRLKPRFQGHALRSLVVLLPNLMNPLQGESISPSLWSHDLDLLR